MNNTMAKTHRLQSGPETIHWGYWDASLPPVLNVASGDRVTIQCVSAIPNGCRRRQPDLRFFPNSETSISRSDAAPEITF